MSERTQKYLRQAASLTAASFLSSPRFARNILRVPLGAKTGVRRHRSIHECKIGTVSWRCELHLDYRDDCTRTLAEPTVAMKAYPISRDISIEVWIEKSSRINRCDFFLLAVECHAGNGVRKFTRTAEPVACTPVWHIDIDIALCHCIYSDSVW